VQQLDVKTVGRVREVQLTGETASSSKLIELLEQSSILQNAAPRGTVTRGSQPGAERFVIAAESKRAAAAAAASAPRDRRRAAAAGAPPAAAPAAPPAPGAPAGARAPPAPAAPPGSRAPVAEVQVRRRCSHGSRVMPRTARRSAAEGDAWRFANIGSEAKPPPRGGGCSQAWW
jgi:hypothetical protein